jgi:CBS domain-containing protein
MLVKEVMTTSVETTQPDRSLQEAAERMKTLNVGPLPVCNADGRLVGMVTDRDITVRAVAQGFGATMGAVRDVMSTDVVFCFEDQHVEDAARLMRDNQIRRLPVLNRNKKLVGIVSLGDLAVETQNEEMIGETLEKISEPLSHK